MSQDSARKDVFTIIEIEGRDSLWIRIGSAFVNRDGSINVFLNALPINGKLQLRDYEPPQEQQQEPEPPKQQQRSNTQSNKQPNRR